MIDVLGRRASCSKPSASPANVAGRILIANERSSRVSWARYPSPIPPAPRGARISCGPNLVPAVTAMRSAAIIAPANEVSVTQGTGKRYPLDVLFNQHLGCAFVQLFGAPHLFEPGQQIIWTQAPFFSALKIVDDLASVHHY
jgi:hypothetical protein